jgi:hypothetical protein
VQVAEIYNSYAISPKRSVSAQDAPRAIVTAKHDKDIIKTEMKPVAKSVGFLHIQ